MSDVNDVRALALSHRESSLSDSDSGSYCMPTQKTRIMQQVGRCGQYRNTSSRRFSRPKSVSDTFGILHLEIKFGNQLRLGTPNFDLAC
jgi:hypothetical protein